MSSNVRLSVDIANYLEPLRLNVSAGRLMANGQPFSLKGIEWRGTERAPMVPDGLRHHSIDFCEMMMRTRPESNSTQHDLHTC